MDNSEMIYTRQEALSLSVPSVVSVVGCGGVGSWIALALALAGVQQLELYDGDAVEPSNLNRTPYRLSDVGKMKSQALAELIRERRSECQVTYHGHFNAAFMVLSSYVICAVDTVRVRKDVAQAASGGYWDVGAEANSFTISDSPASWQIVPDNPGYFTNIFVAPVMAAASFLVWRLLFAYGPPELQRIEFGDRPTILPREETHEQETPQRVVEEDTTDEPDFTDGEPAPDDEQPGF